MRLLHIINSVNPVSGGPIEGVFRQDGATRDLGLREVLSLDHPDDPWVAASPIKVHAMGGRKAKGGFLGHYGYSPDMAPWLKAHVGDYDAVIVNGLWNYATFAAARVLPHAGVPYFVFTHGMMDPWFRRTYPLKNLAKQGFWQVCEGPLTRGAKAVLFTTEEEKLLARGEFWGSRYKEQVVGYGTSTAPVRTAAQAEAFAAMAPELKGRPYLLFLSRIHPKKGVDLLVEAFARAAALQPDLQIVVAGPDQTGSVAALKAQAQTLGIADRLHWPGMLQGDAKWGAYYGAEAFILPSHQENFGIVVAEAMACGKPVLISDKVNIWREVEGAGAGLVEPDTVEGAEALLRRWSALTPDERTAMGVAAQAAFRANFDVEITAPALLHTLRETLQAA
ncbi:MAG: glycosyltransferase [Caulobacteraceae bacterium]|nr:glycosyltransferase [Caulobacteraceae bacterium]